jgi:hypothetical protein
MQTWYVAVKHLKVIRPQGPIAAYQFIEVFVEVMQTGYF